MIQSMWQKIFIQKFSCLYDEKYADNWNGIHTLDLPFSFCIGLQKTSYCVLFILAKITFNINTYNSNRYLKHKFYQITEQTLPEAQRTQGIDSRTLVISPAKTNANSVGGENQVKDWRYLH